VAGKFVQGLAAVSLYSCGTSSPLVPTAIPPYGPTDVDAVGDRGFEHLAGRTPTELRQLTVGANHKPVTRVLEGVPAVRLGAVLAADALYISLLFGPRYVATSQKNLVIDRLS